MAGPGLWGWALAAAARGATQSRLCGPKQATFQAPSATRARAGQQPCRACLRSCFGTCPAGQQAITLQPFWRTPAARATDYQWTLAAFPHTCFASSISGKRILTHLAFGQAFAAGAPILNLFCIYSVSIFHMFCSYCSPVVHLLSALFPSNLRRIFQLFCTYCVSVFASVLHVFCNYFQRLFAAAFTFVWQLSSFSFAQLLNLLCTGFAPIT